MLDKFINKLLCLWVSIAERFPIVTLLIILVLTLFASKFTSDNFSINSDLDRLIKPTKVTPWYQDDRKYRAQFPQYQQKALVVVSGSSAEATYLAAESLYKALVSSKKFADVFAPAFDDFAAQHALYGAPAEGVRYVADKVQGNLPELGRVYRDPTIANFMAHMQTTYTDSANLEVLTPEAKQQFEVLVKGLDALGKPGQTPSLKMVKKLMPQDDGKMSYQFISVKDFEDFSKDMPYAITMEKIRSIIKTQNLGADVQVRITGEVALENDELNEGMSGVQIAGAISTILTLIILVVGIGYGWHSLILNSGMFLMLTVGIVWTTCLSLIAVGSFSTLSIIFLVMFFGLGVEFAIHYTLCVEHYIYNEKTELSPTIAAVMEVGIPLMLSALCAIIGFLSFLPTSYVGLAELGKVSAIGMGIAFITTLTFMPAWLNMFGITSGKYQPRRLAGFGERFGHFFSKQLSFAPKTVLVVIVVLVVASLWYAKDVRFNYSHLAMRNKNTESMETLADIQKHGQVTDYSISVITAPGTDLKAFKEKLLKLPSVAKVDLPEDQIPLFQDIKFQYMQPVATQLNALGAKGKVSTLDKEATRAALQNFAALVQAKKSVFLDEDLQLVNELDKALANVLAHPEYWPQLQGAVEQGIDADISMLRSWFTNKPFGLHDLPETVKSWFLTKDGGQLVNVIPKLDMSDIVQMDQFIAEVGSVSPNIAGRTVIEWGVGNLVVDSFQQAAIITFVAIFILLWLNFRHLTTVVLVFLPLMITTVFMLAIMKFFGISLNMANILVVPMTYGLGVDIGIHVVERYHRCHNVEDLVVSHTTRSVVLGGLTTVSSFVALSFSPHKGAASIGLLLSISMLLLLMVTFIVLPALLAIFQGKKIELIAD